MELRCARCHMAFTLTEGEQQFYRDRHLSQPRHCPACRAWRRHLRQQRDDARYLASVARHRRQRARAS
jgi:hypothetical protein